MLLGWGVYVVLFRGRKKRLEFIVVFVVFILLFLKLKKELIIGL